MAQVTNVTVGYDRKRQPAQYESAGASVSFTAILADDEDYVAAVAKLLGDAKTAVLTELGLVKAGESASAMVIAEGKAEAGSKTPKAPKAPKADKASGGVPDAPAGRQISENPEDRKGPDDLPEDTKTTVVEKKEEPPKPTAQPDGITTAEIHTFVSGLIKANKVTHAQVKETSAKFKVDRINDLKPEQLGPYKAAIEALMSEKKAASDLPDDL